jgi:Divergent InlB B-repeat domain
VKLTPTPAPGKTFVGWSVTGAPACPGTSPCSFNASATSVIVTATFTQ